jgi:hypothetical protein
MVSFSRELSAGPGVRSCDQITALGTGGIYNVSVRGLDRKIGPFRYVEPIRHDCVTAPRNEFSSL